MTHPILIDLTIRQVADGRSWTQIADAAGLKPDTVRGWMRGERSPGLIYIAQLAAELGCDITVTARPVYVAVESPAPADPYMDLPTPTCDAQEADDAVI